MKEDNYKLNLQFFAEENEGDSENNNKMKNRITISIITKAIKHLRKAN